MTWPGDIGMAFRMAGCRFADGESLNVILLYWMRAQRLTAGEWHYSNICAPWLADAIDLLLDPVWSPRRLLTVVSINFDLKSGRRRLHPIKMLLGLFMLLLMNLAPRRMNVGTIY